MFCTKCGKEIAEGAAFCSNCGAKVLAFEKPAYEVAPVVEAPVAQPVAEAPVVPAYAVAPTVEAPVVEETPVAPAYEVPVQPVAEEPVYVPPVQPEVAQPVYTQPAAPAEPVYVPNYQQTDEVKNNGRVGFGDAINLLIKNIVNFSGKASRSEFWFGYLFIGLVTLACMVIPYIGYLLSLGTVLPSLSLSVRRIRDAGREWNYIFMGLIPIVGTILLIITFCKETDYYNDCSLSKR